MTERPAATPRRILGQEQAILSQVNRERPVLTAVRCFEVLDSTMDAARSLLPELAPDGAGLVLTVSQPRGRGRQGRAWAEPKIGFYGTYAFSARYGIGAVVGFSLAVGVAMARLLSVLGGEGRLKWPNDVVSEKGEKLSGVLIEIVTEQGVPWILTGIGINLSGVPEHVESPVSSLVALTGREFTPTEVAVVLSPILMQVWKEFSVGGFAVLREEWLSHAYALGKHFTIQSGNDRIEGRFVGVNDVGSLLLDSGAKTSEIVSGHVLQISV